MKNLIHRFIADKSGTGVVEAGLVILVVAVVLMGAMTSPGENHAHPVRAVASAP